LTKRKQERKKKRGLNLARFERESSQEMGKGGPTGSFTKRYKKPPMTIEKKKSQKEPKGRQRLSQSRSVSWPKSGAFWKSVEKKKKEKGGGQVLL